jgi:DNA-binding NarL/FixJ family response regulator
MIVDEQEIFREGLQTILGATADTEVIAEASTSQEAQRITVYGAVDVLIVEPSSPASDGTEFLYQARQSCPSLRIIVLTVESCADFANRAIKAGASGYLTKNCSASQIIDAVRKVAAGRFYASDEIAEKLMEQVFEPIGPSRHETLSSRELDVLLRVAAGETCTQIAHELMLSIKTISTYKARIKEKLHLGSTAEIVHYAVAHRLVATYMDANAG